MTQYEKDVQRALEAIENGILEEESHPSILQDAINANDTARATARVITDYSAFYHSVDAGTN